MVNTVEFDTELGARFVRYAHMVARRGYVHNTLGNMVMRKPHPDFEHGVAYTKHAEISLEEMTVDNIAEHLAAIKGSTISYRSQDEIDLMHRFAEQVIYPDRPEAVMAPGGS